MNDDLFYIDLSSQATIISDYFGWDRNRMFVPTLTIRDLLNTRTYILEGYDTVWQFLDTICYREPLGRVHFNQILKHRVENFDETSLEIIRGVVSEADIKEILFYGVAEDESFSKIFVKNIFPHYNENEIPSLYAISQIIGDFFGIEYAMSENFEFVRRDKKMDYKRILQTLPSTILISKVSSYLISIIRLVQFPSGKIGLFNIFYNLNTTKKIPGVIPEQHEKEDLTKITQWLRKVANVGGLICSLYENQKENIIPVFETKITSSSTLLHYTNNSRKLYEKLGIYD